MRLFEPMIRKVMWIGQDVVYIIYKGRVHTRSCDVFLGSQKSNWVNCSCVYPQQIWSSNIKRSATSNRKWQSTSQKKLMVPVSPKVTVSHMCLQCFAGIIITIGTNSLWQRYDTLDQWYCYSETSRWMYSKTNTGSAQVEPVAILHNSGTRLCLAIFGRQELDQAEQFLWM